MDLINVRSLCHKGYQSQHLDHSHWHLEFEHFAFHAIWWESNARGHNLMPSRLAKVGSADIDFSMGHCTVSILLQEVWQDERTQSELPCTHSIPLTPTAPRALRLSSCLRICSCKNARSELDMISNILPPSLVAYR